MQEFEEDRFASDDAKMRRALITGDAVTYASLCDKLGIPYEARNNHLYSEGLRTRRAFSSSSSRTFTKTTYPAGLDVSGCILSEASIDYLNGLGDNGLEREDYMARYRHVVKLGSSIPDSLRPKVGASEEEWRLLYHSLAAKARTSLRTRPF